MDAKKELVKLFLNIKNSGWIQTNRHGDQCLGNAFEDLIGKPEDNSPTADYYGIEIKVHRTTTASMVSLFSKAPSYPPRVNSYLREKYGVVEDAHGMKVLNTTVSGAKENTHRGGHNFKINVSDSDQKLYLQVRDSNSGQIIDDEIYWDFSVLQDAIDNKIKTIAVLFGDEKDENGKHFVKYNEMKILDKISLQGLLNSIKDGKLFVDIRIGVYSSGPNIGKTHDHGTGFRIDIDDLLNTYGNVKTYN